MIAMGGRNILTAILVAGLIVLTFICWAPVVNELSQSWVPSGWQSANAELTDMQAPAGKQRFALGEFKITYQYSVNGAQYRNTMYSAPFCCLDTLALYNRYGNSKTVVYFNPSHPQESRAAEIARDYCYSILPTYASAFALGFILLTGIWLGSLFIQHRESQKLRARPSVSASRPAVRKPLASSKR
jgi:hypothetical protein